MKRNTVFFVYLICGFAIQTNINALVHTNIVLGDIDSFTYDGNSDLIEVDSDWLSWAESYSSNFNGLFRAPFDWVIDGGIAYANQWNAFTFTYDLETQWDIISASLSFGFRSADQTSATDFIILEEEGNKYTFEELGWLPITQSGTDIRSLSLSEELVDLLAKNSFNVYIADDTAIDYAVLTIVQVPEPCTLLLLGLGGLALRRKLRR